MQGQVFQVKADSSSSPQAHGKLAVTDNSLSCNTAMIWLIWWPILKRDKISKSFGSSMTKC